MPRQLRDDRDLYDVDGGHDDRMGEGTGRPEDARRARRGGGRGRGRAPGRGRGRQQPDGQDPEAEVWEYLDPDGEIRGPFPSQAMLNWRAAGYFQDDLPVRLVGSSEFKRLQTVVTGMQRECGVPISPPKSEQRPRGRAAADAHFDEEASPYAHSGHPAEALAIDTSERRGGPQREGRGRGPPRNSDYEAEGYGRGGGRRSREPRGRGRNRDRDAEDTQAVALYSVEVARRLFTAEAQVGAEEPVWRYIDLEGNVQGPFPASQMLNWYEKGHLNMTNLLVCGTERKVSPPDLPLPDVHYQEFGYLLSLVQGGMRFTPLTPKNIEDRTVPTYARPPARGPGGRGPPRERGGRGDRIGERGGRALRGEGRGFALGRVDGRERYERRGPLPERGPAVRAERGMVDRADPLGRGERPRRGRGERRAGRLYGRGRSPGNHQTQMVWAQVNPPLKINNKPDDKEGATGTPQLSLRVPTSKTESAMSDSAHSPSPHRKPRRPPRRSPRKGQSNDGWDKLAAESTQAGGDKGKAGGDVHGGDWGNVQLDDVGGVAAEGGGKRREGQRRGERRDRRGRRDEPRGEGRGSRGEGGDSGRRERDRRGRGARGQRSGPEERVTVELQAVEDDFVKLTISPVKPPTARKLAAADEGSTSGAAAEGVVKDEAQLVAPAFVEDTESAEATKQVVEVPASAESAVAEDGEQQAQTGGSANETGAQVERQQSSGPVLVEPAASEEVKPLLAADALKHTASKESASAPDDSQLPTSGAFTAVGASEKLPQSTDSSPGHPGAAGAVSNQEIEKRSAEAEEKSGLESLEAVKAGAKEDSQTAVEPHRQEDLQLVKEAHKPAAETGETGTVTEEEPHSLVQAVRDESAAPVAVSALEATAPESTSTSQVDSTGLPASEGNTAGTVPVPAVAGGPTVIVPAPGAAAATDAGARKDVAEPAGKAVAAPDVANLKEAVTDTMSQVLEMAKGKTAEISGKDSEEAQSGGEAEKPAKKKGGLLSSLIGRFESKPSS